MFFPFSSSLLKLTLRLEPKVFFFASGFSCLLPNLMSSQLENVKHRPGADRVASTCGREVLNGYDSAPTLDFLICRQQCCGKLVQRSPLQLISILPGEVNFTALSSNESRREPCWYAVPNQTDDGRPRLCHSWANECPAESTVLVEIDAARKQLAAMLARIARGDRAALLLLYRDTSAKLFGVCLRILRDNGEAEDVLQDVYMAVWQRAGTFLPDRASPITWLVAIARNRAIDRLRSSAKARAMRPLDDASEVGDGAPSALAQVESGQEYRRLMDCLGELKPRHAGAIRAAFLDGATYDELAQKMDIPLGTVKSWIRRSLMRLRECLER